MKHFSQGTAGVYRSPLRRGGGGQVSEKTGRDRLTPSTAVRLQDGRTAPLRTLNLTYTLQTKKKSGEDSLSAKCFPGNQLYARLSAILMLYEMFPPFIQYLRTQSFQALW